MKMDKVSARGNGDAGPVLSILIVNYNGGLFVDSCLRSIYDMVSLSFEVILFDNGSDDGSPEHIGITYPWVVLVRSKDNLGFVRGTNLAASHATGKYYLLLNVDTVLMSDLAAAVDVLEHVSSAGIVGATMLGHKGESRRNTGYFPSPMRLWKLSHLYCDPERKPYGQKQLHAFRVDWVEGSFLLTRSHLWRQTGGLDEAIYMYGEEVEFCKRCASAGYDCVLCTLVQYKHFGGFSLDRTPYLYRGFRYYHRKFSSSAVRVCADAVMKTGLYLRVVLYFLSYLVTKDPHTDKKRSAFSEVLRDWKEGPA
jgi:GT2 family glycosyltransferase